jgi:cytochrome P450/NADPH-cytochrome P450 reductase
MIMVGAGTGVAPFRGFLQERADLKEKGAPIGESILFFGCRNAENDFLYADELQRFADSGVTDLQVAFSRAEGQPRTYVQDLIEREQDHVWDLLAAGAVIYICGNAHTMAPGVRAALTKIHQNKTSGSAEAAQQWLADLKASDRLLEDIWGETAAGI